MNADLSTAARFVDGTLHGNDRAFNGVSTDTRTLRGDELFVALSGPNFDGRDYVDLAREKGAAGAIVVSPVESDIAQITVEDTKLALGQLGASWRDLQSATVVGITGSNGKTTLKELTAACLSHAAPTLATQGNLNNDIGMPLMLSRIDATHRYAIFEMGANHPGEISYLTSLAKPDIVVITNAGAAHLEGFGSVEGVAKAKAEILQGDARPDFAVLNTDDEYFSYWQSFVSDISWLSFGLSENADIRGDEITVDKGLTRFLLHIGDTAVPVSLPLAGLHNVRNACAAAAIATTLGMKPDDIASALEAVSPITGRLQTVAGLHGATIFDDSYNANPVSVIAAGEYLASLTGQNWVVFGDMKELGEDEQRLHLEVGRALKKAGIKRLFATGKLGRETVAAFGNGASWFETVDELAGTVLKNLTGNVNVLVKGSRSMRMERVVDKLRAPEAMRKEA
jgi:UDP-N-acetylmuramoyl-tripeptide--D-alanyl-D-alanine ligase